MSSQEDPEENATADDEPAAGEAEEPENRAPETPEDDAGGDDDGAGQAEEPENRAPEAPDGDAGEGDDGEEEDRPPTEDERLEQLTDRIEKARTQAEEAGVLVDDDAEEYVESGATEEEDDQTITPPG
jgi:hypothetical protein